MVTVEKELDRILTLLRNKIRQRGFTQLEVQDVLGWGRSYISQLLTKQKSLRFEQVLLILEVIGEDPAEFFNELHSPLPSSVPSMAPPLQEEEIRQSLGEVRSLVRGVIKLLVGKQLLTLDELATAVEQEPGPLSMGD
jgi:transcriptional regulator with XRE-family HTH domain